MEFKEDIFTTPWGVEVKVYTREGTNDWNTLYSCIAQDEYKIGDLKYRKGDLCVDIGAHGGGCSLAMLSRGYKVIAVEPLPENVELIMKNVEANGWEKNFILYNKAINEVSDKQVVIRYGNEETESGFHHRFIGNTVDSSEWQPNLWTQGREIQVNTINLDDILKEVNKVSLLKIDCEGAEWSAFTNVSPESLNKIQKITAELHAISTTKKMYEEFHALIGSDFKNTTSERYKDIENYETIGLAYFEK